MLDGWWHRNDGKGVGRPRHGSTATKTAPELVDQTGRGSTISGFKNPWDSTTGEDFSRPRAVVVEAALDKGASMCATTVRDGENDGLKA